MIELYTANLAVTGQQTIPWNVKSVQAGNTATLNDDGKTINLNVPGIYEVSVSSYGSMTTAGEIAFQLNGASEIARGSTEQSVGANEYGSISFTTLIGVSATSVSTAKAALTLDYVGDTGTLEIVNIVVKKVL